MKRFEFSLRTLLKYKINLEKKRKSLWALARQKRFEEERLLEEYKAEEASARKRMEEFSLGAVDLERLRSFPPYVRRLLNLQRAQQSAVKEALKEEEERFQEWIQTRKEKKALENYRAKLWKEYLRELDKSEQIEMDDIFINSGGGRKHENTNL